MSETPKQEVVVIARCVGCGAIREIRAGEVPAGEMPMCSECFSPMVATKATKRRAR